MSFIRDVDAARKRNDSEFLSNFMVLLKDGTSVEGERATKEFLRANDSQKPEWYINESLLKSKYWSAKKPKSKKTSVKSKSSNESEAGDSGSTSTGSRYIRLLEETNRQNQIQINEQMSLIRELSDNQRQSNVLVKSLTDLIGRSGVLGEAQNSPESFAIPVAVSDSPKRSKTADIETVEVIGAPKKPVAPSSSAPKTSETPKSIWQRDLFWFVNDRFKK